MINNSTIINRWSIMFYLFQRYCLIKFLINFECKIIWQQVRNNINVIYYIDVNLIPTKSMSMKDYLVMLWNIHIFFKYLQRNQHPWKQHHQPQEHPPPSLQTLHHRDVWSVNGVLGLIETNQMLEAQITNRWRPRKRKGFVMEAMLQRLSVQSIVRITFLTTAVENWSNIVTRRGE